MIHNCLQSRTNCVFQQERVSEDNRLSCQKIYTKYHLGFFSNRIFDCIDIDVECLFIMSTNRIDNPY